MTQLTVEQTLETALEALNGGGDWRKTLDALPVPTYVTDAEGAVTYWNQACVDFAGREPELGKDRWCVTWQLYTTTGDLMPHDQCPMAEAIKTGSSVRGAVAIAMRPDGSRRAFTPYPTPLFDSDGKLTGAVNLLVDVTDEQFSALRDQASRCRRLAQSTTDREALEILESMARNYEQMIAGLRAAS